MFWIALRLALKNITLSLPAGSLTAFVGKDVWEKAKAQMKK